MSALVLLAACTPGLANRAFAQQVPPGETLKSSDPRVTASMRFGIFYLSPRFSIDRIGIDSNVFTSAGEQKSDFTVSVTPATTVWVPVARRALVTAQLGVGFVYYKTFKNLRSVNPGIDAQAELYARRLTFLADVSTAASRTRPNYEIDTRVKQVTSRLGAGVRLQMQRGFSLELSTYRRTTGFGSDATFLGVNLGDALDRAEQGVRLRVRERLTSFTTVGVIAETRQDRFERSSDRDAEGYRVVGAVELDPKAFISGTAEIGFRHVKPKDPLVPTFNGLVASVAVANKLGDAFQSRLGWDKDAQYSFDPSLPYYVSHALSGTVRRQLAGRFDAIIGAVRNSATYRARSSAQRATDRREVTMIYSVDLGSRLGRDSRLGLTVSRTNRTSNMADSRQYGATSAGFSFNYGF